MRTAKTDQTGRMPRMISVFAGRTGHFVDFIMLWLIYLFELTHETRDLASCGLRSFKRAKEQNRTEYFFIVEYIVTV